MAAAPCLFRARAYLSKNWAPQGVRQSHDAGKGTGLETLNHFSKVSQPTMAEQETDSDAKAHAKWLKPEISTGEVHEALRGPLLTAETPRAPSRSCLRVETTTSQAFSPGTQATS